MKATRLRRLARAQKALAGAAQAEHSAAATALAQERSNRAAILAVLDRDGPFHGIVAATMPEALKASGRRTQRLSQEAEAAERNAAHQEVAARILMRKADAALRCDARATERRRLEALEHPAAYAAKTRWSRTRT